MLYLFIDKNIVKVLYLKKSLLGQYETKVFSKTYQASDLLENGKIVNIDFVASAVKEALQSLTNDGVKTKEVLLILPQEAYTTLRIHVPAEITTSAVPAFINDKVKANLSINLDDCKFDWFIEDGAKEKYIYFFAVDKDNLALFQQALQLIELKVQKVLPESVAYFKLFQKTLRKEKKENIFYVAYENNRLTGLLYDSFGQLSSDKWNADLDKDKKIGQVLKEKVDELNTKGIKLNRLILAGAQSDKVRQDTFTKEIGVWTNPIKRIIPEFYQEYLKLLIGSTNKPFSILSYEVCIGTFIFNEQNKKFSLLNDSGGGRMKKILTLPRVNLAKKEVLIFLASFIVSFIFFLLISRSHLNLKFSFIQKKLAPIAQPSPTPPPARATSTPTPAIPREEIKIKVLNGVGTVGLANEVKELLKEKGFQEILTDNADNFNYQQSELQVKKSKEEITFLIKSDLKDNVSSFKETALDEDETADAVIIIGLDFK
ncbi:hypothetical protein A2774_03560 [Candidatus Roizmanbacteria bacterium RIFCSPHIGHO2_01_FULL_39_12c]|uniref:LytR/CpsA/Psr regulator C-terminal domain-containing protein n=1 Tax=Candidatus Roizmanbacteria bacterium RIFCSPHIGHO2_01_FULL_39_12c TaxID=1802031 RepID=A0A1F7G904_9BACT|nr:MAG: hypothetical protein A2774_03560 [Candidatus Roizmanbacteria bacterium RIFCSPHIGHO2_01_FULL_39_12c]OGK47821.1 MAG: hypothetical protein A2963_03135 [Candidatus Roizmanbacteria bacterium RIFCSPLOWO2_01_FULL_40_13]